MILSMSNQAMLFLTAIILGLFVAFVYDILRIFRRTIAHAVIFIHLEDLLYWLFVSFIVFYVMLYKNYGEIRAFLLLGAALGMLFYFLTISRFVIGISMTVIHFFQKVLTATLNLMLFPVKLVIKLFSYPARACKKYLKKTKSYAKIKNTKLRNELKIILKKI